MANTTITGMVADPVPILTDLFESTKDPGGTPLTRKVTHGAMVESTFQVASGVPANSTDVTVFTSVVPLSGEFLDVPNFRLYKWNGAKWHVLVTHDV